MMPKHAPDTTFWPDQVLKDAVACLAVLAVVLMLAIFAAAELSAPADPAVNFSAARPEWYFLFLFRFLRFHAVESLGLTFGAIVVPGIIMGIIAIMPITAKVLGEWGHRLNKAFIWLMACGIAVLTGMAFYEDANDQRIIRRLWRKLIVTDSERLNWHPGRTRFLSTELSHCCVGIRLLRDRVCLLSIAPLAIVTTGTRAVERW
jgi:quinol-cytochrome oxidoreductase complex cytochrome b subunit